MGNCVKPFSISAAKPFCKEGEETVDGILCNEPERSRPQVNRKVEVLWPKDEKYYPRTIISIEETTRKRTFCMMTVAKNFLIFTKKNGA